MNTALESLRTIHLFVQADYKTVMLPVAFISYFATPHTTPLYFLRAMTWTFIQLLYFCISNQIFDPAEDALNKPWRPIPSGRISLESARRLRWAVLPLMVWTSWVWGAEWEAVAMIVLGTAYNDDRIGAGKHWIARQGSVAVMYGALNYGAARVACDQDPAHLLSSTYILRHILNALVILTTVQAADFRDASGDAERGRVTLPIVFPKLARRTMPLLMLGWSMAVCAVSESGVGKGLGVDGGLPTLALVQAVFSLAGLGAGLRFELMKDEKADRRSYLYYDLWLCLAQIMPFL